MPQPQTQGGMGPGPFGAGFPLFLIRSLACSLEVFLHKTSTFGERYFGAQAAFAGLVMFLFPALMPREDPEPMLWFLGAYFLALMAAGASCKARRHRGAPGPHSYYTGTPRLLGRLKESTVKGVVEPFVAVLVGVFVHEANAVLGAFLITAGIGLLFSAHLTRASERQRVLDMHDAFEEQRFTAEEWRRIRRE